MKSKQSKRGRRGSFRQLNADDRLNIDDKMDKRIKNTRELLRKRCFDVCFPFPAFSISLVHPYIRSYPHTHPKSPYILDCSIRF